MSFIEVFFKKEPKDVTVNDIEEFVARSVEENLNLDYKDIKAFGNIDELSKDISAFANSDGGLMILGVSEKSPKEGNEIIKIFPKEITWGERTLSREKLEDSLIAKVHPRINGLKVIPIRKNESVIFLIDIPQGDNPPYMASDHRYYKRLNFRRVPMEHYEVADLFGKRRKPLLTSYLTLEDITIKDDSYQFKLRLYIANRGKAVAKYVLFGASFFNADILAQEGFARIDAIRGGIPSIQYSYHQDVIHPHPVSKTNLGTVTLVMKDNKQPVKIKYDIEAEDTFPIEGSALLTQQDLEEGRKMINEGKKAALRTEERSLFY